MGSSTVGRSGGAPAAQNLERRLYFHAFSGRSFFYVPILVHYLTGRLEDAGIVQAQTATMSLLALFAVGLAVAEYPSGVFADWAGRGRSLIVGSVLYATAVLLLWVPGPIAIVALSQFLLGVASAFRSGADSALVYSHLLARGETHRYATVLARVRFMNLAGLTLACAAGGFLYAWEPSSVFWLTAAAIALGTVPLFGLIEPRPEQPPSHYWGVVAEGVAEIRRNRGAQALVLLGGAGATYFIFAYWATQAYLVGVGTSPAMLGQIMALLAVLQAATMPLSAWMAGRAPRQTPVFAGLLVGIACAFALVSLATRVGVPAIGGVALVVAASCAPLFRNLTNVRLQPLVPDGVRASMVSLETWVGALYYTAFFPFAGWLIDETGVVAGYGWIAWVVAVTSLPLLALSRARRL